MQMSTHCWWTRWAETCRNLRIETYCSSNEVFVTVGHLVTQIILHNKLISSDVIGWQIVCLFVPEGYCCKAENSTRRPSRVTNWLFNTGQHLLVSTVPVISSYMTGFTLQGPILFNNSKQFNKFHWQYLQLSSYFYVDKWTNRVLKRLKL